MWDLRKFKVPLYIYSNLPNLASTTGVCFSPDDRLAVTGTSAGPDGAGGSLVFIDLSKETIVRRVAMPSSVVGVHWSQRLNQIFVGSGKQPFRRRMRCNIFQSPAFLVQELSLQCTFSNVSSGCYSQAKLSADWLRGCKLFTA